jgi:acyl carrier protein
MKTTFKNNTDFEGKVKAIIACKLGVDEKEITPQANFSDNLYADFLDMVDLVMEFEKEFNISIPDDQIEKISTVSEAIASVRKNGKQKMQCNSASTLLIGPPLYRGFRDGNPSQ